MKVFPLFWQGKSSFIRWDLSIHSKQAVQNNGSDNFLKYEDYNIVLREYSIIKPNYFFATAHPYLGKSTFNLSNDTTEVRGGLLRSSLSVIF